MQEIKHKKDNQQLGNSKPATMTRKQKEKIREDQKKRRNNIWKSEPQGALSIDANTSISAT